jgi:mannitol-specific phosphotransferase system IIBC component
VKYFTASGGASLFGLRAALSPVAPDPAWCQCRLAAQPPKESNMKLTNLLVGLSLVAFATASAYAQDDKKKSDDKDKAAATSQEKEKEKSKEASSDKKEAAAGATAKKDEKKDSK